MRIILVTVLLTSIFTFAGCSSTAKPTAADNKSVIANSAPSKEAPKTILKAGDVGPDKSVAVSDLVDGVVADANGWKGKQVVVTGYVSSTSSSGGKGLLSLSPSKEDNKRTVTCALQGDVPDDAFDRNAEVKGTIKFLPAATDESKSVNLEPCELKK